MALEGLFPGEDQRKTLSTELSIQYPKLVDMLDYILEQQPALTDSAGLGQSKLIFHSATFVAMIKFLLKCFESDVKQKTILEDSKFVYSVDKLCSLLEHAMAYEGSIELHADASKALITVATHVPQVHYIEFQESKC